jgi:hypothetical protein
LEGWGCSHRCGFLQQATPLAVRASTGQGWQRGTSAGWFLWLCCLRWDYFW